MTPAENEFIERQFEHLFRTDDCTLCEWALPDNALTSFGLSCDGTAALVGECCQAKIKTNRRGAPRPGWDAWGNEADAPADDRDGVLGFLDRRSA